MVQENYLRITAQTVISQMLEGHKTFEDLATKYGKTEEEIKKIVARVVNDKDYPRLVKANDKYVTARSRVGKNKISYKKKENKKKSLEQKEQNEDAEILRQEKEKELNSIEKQIAKSNVEIERVEKEKISAMAELEISKKALEVAEEKYSEIESSQQKISKRLEQLNIDKEKISKEIQEIDSKIIFLIAPNYKGQKPAFGTFISVIPMEGAKVEDVSDTILTSEMSAEDIFLFESMDEAKAVSQYLKLVTKYFVDNKEYKLLIDDDNEVLTKLLKKQELI